MEFYALLIWNLHIAGLAKLLIDATLLHLWLFFAPNLKAVANAYGSEIFTLYTLQAYRYLLDYGEIVIDRNTAPPIFLN